MKKTPLYSNLFPNFTTPQLSTMLMFILKKSYYSLLLFFTLGIYQPPIFGQPAAAINSLKFIGGYEIPFALPYNNTTVGGLSGIDYDAANKRYFFICDDRSALQPARFYEATIALSQKGIDTIQFTGVYQLLQPDGSVYPNNSKGGHLTPDPEAMRYDPLTKTLIWSSEGERTIDKNNSVLANPALNRISLKGNFENSFLLPPNLTMQAEEKGPRQNGVLEGITFADNYTSLFVNVEEPLYEDGPRADTMDNNAYIRILKFDVARKNSTQQFAYKLDPVAHPPFPAGGFKINGVSDILSIGKNKLLVIERSFSSGRLSSTIKLYIADLTGASDISNNISLIADNNFVPATKKLLLNLDDLGIYIDNIEGVTFGPVLPNGHKTFVMVADNNFNPLEKSQLLLFEVIE